MPTKAGRSRARPTCGLPRDQASPLWPRPRPGSPRVRRPDRWSARRPRGGRRAATARAGTGGGSGQRPNLPGDLVEVEVVEHADDQPRVLPVLVVLGRGDEFSHAVHLHGAVADEGHRRAVGMGELRPDRVRHPGPGLAGVPESDPRMAPRRTCSTSHSRRRWRMKSEILIGMMLLLVAWCAVGGSCAVGRTRREHPDGSACRPRNVTSGSASPMRPVSPPDRSRRGETPRRPPPVAWGSTAGPRPCGAARAR